MTSIMLAQSGHRPLPRKSISNSTDWWERPEILGSSPFQKPHRLWNHKTLADVTLNYETGVTFFKLKVCVGWLRILKRNYIKLINVICFLALKRPWSLTTILIDSMARYWFSAHKSLICRLHVRYARVHYADQL